MTPTSSAGSPAPSASRPWSRSCSSTAASTRPTPPAASSTRRSTACTPRPAAGIPPPPPTASSPPSTAGHRIYVYGDYDVDGVTGSATCAGPPPARRHRRTSTSPPPPRGLRHQPGKPWSDRRNRRQGRRHRRLRHRQPAEAERRAAWARADRHRPPRDEGPCPTPPCWSPPPARHRVPSACSAAPASPSSWPGPSPCASAAARRSPPPRELLLDGVALAALGVVADVVPCRTRTAPRPLRPLCRCRKTLARRAGPLRGRQDRPGRRACRQRHRLRLAPRINAAGRMGERCWPWSCSPPRARARRGPRPTHRVLNESRQKLERDTVTKARQLIEAEKRRGRPRPGPRSADWHGRIVGIVAGRLASCTPADALVTCPKGRRRHEHARLAVGSGRSIAASRCTRRCASAATCWLDTAGTPRRRLPPAAQNVPPSATASAPASPGTTPGGTPAPELVLDERPRCPP